MKKSIVLALSLLSTQINALELPAANCTYDENNFVLVSYDYKNTTNNPLPKIENFRFTAVQNGEVIETRISQTVQLLKSNQYQQVSNNGTVVDWNIRHSKALKTLIIKNDRPEYKDFLLQKVGNEFVELHDHYYLTEEDKTKLIADTANFNHQRNAKYGVIPAFKLEGVAYELCTQ